MPAESARIGPVSLWVCRRQARSTAGTRVGGVYQDCRDLELFGAPSEFQLTTAQGASIKPVSPKVITGQAAERSSVSMAGIPTRPPALLSLYLWPPWTGTVFRTRTCRGRRALARAASRRAVACGK